MKLNIKNEYDELIKVLLAPVDSKYLNQQKQLIDILNKYNVEVILSKKNNQAKYQMFTRDPFIVIKDKIIISNMKENIRKLELKTIDNILERIDNSKKIYLKDNIFLEGGDIIIHNNIIFVGQNGNRTNKEGLIFLKEIFEPEYKIIPLCMLNSDKKSSWIHLDCLFNPLDSKTALIYKNGFEKKSLKLLENLFSKLIEVNDKEQEQLATNILNLGNKTVIIQKRHNNLKRRIEEYGFKVEIMDIYDTIDEVGYTRCLTCPLERK